MKKIRKTMLLLAAAASLGGPVKLAAQISLTLPTPFFIENFDQVQEGALPTGWTVQNFTDSLVPGLDLDDPKSDSYLDWVVISRDRVAALPWEGPRRLNTLPGQFVNGVEVTNLVTGNLIYAESDTRGANQIQYLFSKDIDCTGKTNVYLSYHSMYEQNQDNIGAVEYSIDGGTNWLPIVYMIDAPDIIKDAGGVIDGYATLNAPQTDTAIYTDPVSGEEKGGTFGAFIGVSSNLWSTLSPYISGRINDDAMESKRVEFFPLPQAANQAKVRLRFAQAGTGSWYFGVDDVGLYNIQTALPPAITESPLAQLVSSGATVTLKVTATGDALRYQWKFNGTNLVGQTNATLAISKFAAANAGDYQVIVTNAGGDVPSAIAKLEVFEGTIADGLVVHLKFDNNLDDSSGKTNNGTAVGAPSFSTGQVGTNALHIPSGADYVTLGVPADLNFSTNVDFTIAFWTKLTEWNGDPSFIGNKNWGNGGNPGYVFATDDDGHFQWNFAGAPGVRKDYDGPAGTFSDHLWHHIAVSFKRTGAAITYVDGKVVNTKSIAADQNDVNTPEEMATNIGQDGTGAYGSSFTDGDIDDLGIWRRVLTSQEVAAIVDAGKAGKDLSTIKVEAPLQDVTQPGDTIVSSSAVGDSPATEQVANAIDNSTDTKYLNFLKLNTGFTVTPKAGASVLSGIALTSANDAPERDPSSYKLEGSNDGLTFVLISQGTVPAFSGRFVRQEIRFTNAVTDFSATLTGAAERPTPVVTTATGSGTFSVAGDQLTYHITYTGLSSGATAGHIHGPATAEQTAGVLIPFAPAPTGTSGTLTGTVTATATQLTELQTGLTYANLHTTINPTGEIRGQIMPTGYKTYRVTFPTVADAGAANSMQIAEVELLGTVVGTPETPNSNISISSVAGKVTVTFQGTLLSAPSVNGPYAAIAGATSPYTVTIGPAAQFFIVH